MHASRHTDQRSFDFSVNILGPLECINDGTRGGLSRSRLATFEGVGVFSGGVSLKNHGSFASARTQVTSGKCSGSQVLLLRVRADGKRCKCTARMDTRITSLQYQLTFATRMGEWQVGSFQLEVEGIEVVGPYDST